MKKCKNCGTVHSDDNMICLDCSCPLGPSMTENENEDAESAIKEKVDEMAERSDEFYVSRRDRMMGYACIFLAVAAILLMILSNLQLGKLEPERVTQINDYVLPENAVITLPTKRMKQLDNASACALITIITAVFSCLMLLLPRLMWLWDTWKYRVHYGWDTPPSHLVMLARKISAYMAFGIALISLINGWILFF